MTRQLGLKIGGILGTIVAAAGLWGCATLGLDRTTPYSVATISDEVSGATVTEMLSNRLGSRDDLTKALLIRPSDTVELNVERLESKNGKVAYSFIVIYEGSTRLSDSEGRSLFFLVDEERMEFSAAGSPSQIYFKGGRISETDYYHDIDPTILKRIASAKEVNVKIPGDRVHDRHFTEANFENFKRFLAEYIKE